MSSRPPEEEHFARLEREKKDKLKAKLDAERAAAALEERKRLHWHRCGKCGANMNSIGYRGVEIEVCPDCGAVLLDNGELESLAGRDQGGLLSGMFASIFGAGKSER